ncbi:unnamed protein product [Mycena citricolor]|uniref:Phorbol-ester/DAG-type domain-containing protein n=2 Tax=Mycena citricolor TaxID=2018698 RepID=A0AAD2Q5B0_9AGAR|nr:unnamed protein product [Mycena citricolor]
MPAQQNKSPFRISRSRNSLQPGRRSRSPSPAHPNAPPHLLEQCVSVLASIILEDCRFRMHLPRPSRPPNSLQAMVLDVGQFLIHTHRHDSKIVADLSLALIPAFSSFPSEMHIRLLSFFEEGIFRHLLDDLQRARGMRNEAGRDEVHAIPGAISITVAAYEDSPTENGPYGWAPWSSATATDKCTVSASAPGQSQVVTRLAALISPLLATVLEFVDANSERLDVVHRFYRLMDLIVSAKPDAYMDVLEVAAYHPQARRSALALLFRFWPKALGHLVIARPLDPQSSPHLHVHQFLPWRYDGQLVPCHSCAASVEGFGLQCPFCLCSVHFGCHDDPGGSLVLPYSPDENVQRLASFRFSTVLDDRWHLRPRRTGGHSWRLVNMFTMCLCCVCRKPLWGCSRQGLHCGLCFQFVHSTCVLPDHTCFGKGTTHSPESISIEWAMLRASCKEHYPSVLSLTEQELSSKSYEEICILSGMLWAQLQIMTNGVSSGSIEILQKGKSAAHAKGHKVDDFELHHVLRWCEGLLASDLLRQSISMGDYLELSKQPRSVHGLLYDWTHLTFIASTIKSPYPIPITSSTFLNVSGEEPASESQHPFEMAPLGHMRDILGYEFLVHSDVAAQFLLSHLQDLGFFTALNPAEAFVDVDQANSDSMCVFPIPLGMDISSQVETLYSAIEACLADLDLSVNETGFLLLLRKLWPNGMATDYSLKRLLRAVVTWIVAEKEVLATILRDYLTKGRPLPGVRLPTDSVTWASSRSGRMAPANGGNNGGDYLAARRALQSRYVLKWLSELYRLDPELYGTLVYEVCCEIIEAQSHTSPALTAEEQKLRDATSLDGILGSIQQFVEVVSDDGETLVFESLFLRWLERVSDTGLYMMPMPTLLRLFPRDADLSQRHSTYGDLANLAQMSAQTDPWRVVVDTASQSRDGFLRSIEWLCCFARSGVEISAAVFERFSSLAPLFHASLEESTLLVEAIMAATWLRPASRERLQAVIASLHTLLLPRLVEDLAARLAVPQILEFIRKSLGTCLLLYGSHRETIVDLGLIKGSEVDSLPSRRKVNGRGEPQTDPIVIHAEIVHALETYLTTATVEEVPCLIAKYLNLFLHDTPFLQSYEVDNFILRNARFLTECAWKFYEIQRHDISSVRTSFFLRVVVVDSQPLQQLLHEWLLPTAQWQQRLLAVTRLFRVVMDVTSPLFNIDGRQWRSSVIEVFYRFFSALWVDEKEEIRVVVDTFTSSLLPPHFDAISHCWTEALAISPIAERVKLVSFLIQLRPHFPSWKVLTWEVIIEIGLSEDEFDHKNDTVRSATHLSLYGLASSRDEVGVQSFNTDPDMSILRGTTLLLSLRMISDGVPIDPFQIQKIKVALVKAIGFADVSVAPSTSGQNIVVYFGDSQHIPENFLPCVNELFMLLDAPHPLEHNDASFLVGSAFADVILNLICTGDLMSLPVLTLKSLVESLGVTLYKHNFDHRRLKHLQPSLRRAVLRVLELMLDDVSYEIRQLCLSATQAFIKRWPAYTGSIVYTSVEQACKLIAMQPHSPQDALVGQAKAFVGSTLTMYASNGFVATLFKRRLDPNLFTIVKDITDAKARQAVGETLRETLLRDTLPRIAENDAATIQTMMGNVLTFMEVVHHQNYSADLMAFVGQQIVIIARRFMELSAEGAALETGPLFMIPALVIQHNKSNSRETVLAVDSILRVLLQRVNVEFDSLSRLIHVTASMYRKTQPGEASPVVFAVFEALSDVLRFKARASPLSLKSMIEVVASPDQPGLMSFANTHTNHFMSMAEFAFPFLQNYTWTDPRSDNDFYACLAVAKLVVQAAALNSSIYGRLSDSTERAGRQNLSVRTWNITLLAILLENSTTAIGPVFGMFSAFSTLHNSTLRAYSTLATNVDEATTDINHAYIALKLWLLLIHKTSAESNASALMVWNELWPPFERLIGVLEGNLGMGMSLTIASMTWSTIADIFIFLRCLRTPAALEIQPQVSILNRLKTIGGQDSSMSKVTRALKFLSEPPPDIGTDALVHQTVKDFIAAEKVRLLESVRAGQGR